MFLTAIGKQWKNKLRILSQILVLVTCDLSFIFLHEEIENGLEVENEVDEFRLYVFIQDFDQVYLHLQYHVTLIFCPIYYYYY